MVNRIGIRLEDKNAWERRVPISPFDMDMLVKKFGIQFSIQPFPNRAFKDSEYEKSGAKSDPELAECPVIIGIKEMPIDFFEQGKTYIFFSHVIKGQDYNMPMLQRIIDLECNLIDYEKITDENGLRLVFFGSEAGQAGMIDSLWALGLKLSENNIKNPFISIRQAIAYDALEEAENEISRVAEKIKKDGIPD